MVAPLKLILVTKTSLTPAWVAWTASPVVPGSWGKWWFQSRSRSWAEMAMVWVGLTMATPLTESLRMPPRKVTNTTVGSMTRSLVVSYLASSKVTRPSLTTKWLATSFLAPPSS